MASNQAESLYRCGIYVRVSTEEQAENPEGSIKNQEQRLREFVKLKQLVGSFGEVSAVFSDPGFSAKDMNRPGFQKLLQAIERKEINLVLVTELSRLTRSMKDFGLLQEFLRKHSCEFLSLRENFDTSSATGGMVLNIMASIAEFERRQTAERISQAFLARAKRGLYNGGSVPLGYEVDPDKRGSLAIVEDEAETVKLVFSSFLKKETMAQAAKWLNDQGIQLPRRVRGSGKVRGRIFQIDTVHSILRNPTYAGIREYRVRRGAGFEAEQTKANWEPIIDAGTFNRVQELLTKNRYRKRSHLNLRFPFTLSGVCYCQACGHRMSGKSAHGRAGKVPYYEHSWARAQDAALNRPQVRCQPFRILANKIEPEVWSDVKRFLTQEEFVRELLENAKRATPELESTQELKRLETKHQNIGRQIEVLAERIAKLPEKIDPQALYAQLDLLQRSQTDVEKARDQSRSRQSAPTDLAVNLESLQAFTVSFRALLSEADKSPEMRAAIIRKVVHRIEVMKDGYEIFFHLGQAYFERECPSETQAGKLTETQLTTATSPQKENGGLATARPPTKPLNRFFLDSGSKRLENGGPCRT